MYVCLYDFICGRFVISYDFLLTHFFSVSFCSILCTGPASSVGCASAWYADGRGFDHPARQHSFVEIGHEIISTALHPPVVSYWRKNVHLVNRLGLSLPSKSVVRLTDRLDMTVAIDWDVKPRNNNNNKAFCVLCHLSG